MSGSLALPVVLVYIVHHVAGQTKLLGLMDDRQNAEGADAVGNKVRCVLRARTTPLPSVLVRKLSSRLRIFGRVAAAGISSARCM